MSRSSWKFSFEQIAPSSELVNSNWKITQRRSAVSEEFIGKTVQISNGQAFTKRTITPLMVGYKFGALAPTRIRHKFAKKKIRNNCII